MESLYISTDGKTNKLYFNKNNTDLEERRKQNKDQNRTYR